MEGSSDGRVFPITHMDQPPKLIDCALLKAFAILDSTVVFTNRTQVFVDGNRIERVPGLAICQQLDETDFLLFYCNDRWDVLGVDGFNTLQSAMERAEVEYIGVSKLWQFPNVQITDLAPEDLEPKCSFCGKPYFKVEGFFEGTNAQIRFDCVRKFHDDLAKPEQQ